MDLYSYSSLAFFQGTQAWSYLIADTGDLFPVAVQLALDLNS